MNWPTNRLLIGAVGRLSAEKGFDLLIRATNIAVVRGLDLGLVIAGDGPDRAALQKQIEELRLSDRVRLLGFQSDLRPLYEAMDLFVLSSIREGLPNVLLEAMALEVPIIATRISGVPRVVADGENGILVPPGDDAALAQAIVRTLTQPDLRSQFAAAGRRTIDARYSFAVRMKKIAAVYDDLLGNKREPHLLQ
jgi:glycosyltransferase involved in cell wall biosynthesis